MTSALTTAALAVPGLIGYYPLEEGNGATTATDASGNGLSALTLQGAGASSHILPNQVAQVPGAAGAWFHDGTAGGLFMSRNVPNADPMQLSTWTLAGWVLAPNPAAGNIGAFGRGNNWSWRFANSAQGSTWSSGTNYQPGQVVFNSPTSYVALLASGPGNGGAVTPGTNAAVWEPLVSIQAFPKFTTAGNVQQNAINPAAVGKPLFVAMTYDGFDCSLWLNGVRETYRYVQTAAGAWDTVSQTTDVFSLFGSGGTVLSCYSWGWGIWNNALGAGAQRSIYLAGIGTGNEIAARFTTIDTVRDQATPQIINSGSVTYYCEGCSGGLRAAEGYITVASRRYHHGCYTARRTGITPSLLSNTSTVADLADRMSRVTFQILSSVCRRENVEKRFFHDGTYLQPWQSPTNAPLAGGTTDWRTWTDCLGGAAALLARYSRANRESWLVTLASNQMEYLIAATMGAPSSWLGSGWSTIAATPVSGATAFGCVQPAFDTTSLGNNQSWVLKTMCLTYLCLKRQVSAATLARWEQAIVAVANWLVSGSSLTNPFTPVPPATNYAVDALNTKPGGSNQWWYVNGNYMIRYAIDFYLTWLVTGDARWKAQHDWSLNYALYPYGQALTWQGNWAATTTYNTTGDNVNGPHAVRSSGNAYKCVQNVAGTVGNASPANDPTHWQLIDQGNTSNRQGYGLIVDVKGSDAAFWSDYKVHLNEFGSGAGGGPPGSPLVGQPGYDGDYTVVQTDDCAFGYLLTGNPTYRQLANALMNTSGSYPSGGAGTNPQTTPFSFGGVFVAPGTYGGSGVLWVIDKTSGQSGGYSTRHSLTDPYRSPWLPVSQLLGYRSDLTAGFGTAEFVTTCEKQLKDAVTWSQYSSGLVGSLSSVNSLFFMASPSWPGLPS